MKGIIFFIVLCTVISFENRNQSPKYPKYNVKFFLMHFWKRIQEMFIFYLEYIYL